MQVERKGLEVGQRTIGGDEESCAARTAQELASRCRDEVRTDARGIHRHLPHRLAGIDEVPGGRAGKPQRVTDCHDIVDHTVVAGRVGDRHDPHILIEHPGQGLDVHRTIRPIGHGLHDRPGAGSELQKRQHIGGVFRRCDEDAITGLQRFGVHDCLQCPIPGDGRRLDQRHLVGTGTHQPCNRYRNICNTLRCLSMCFVAADLGLAAQMCDLGVHHDLRR